MPDDLAEVDKRMQHPRSSQIMKYFKYDHLREDSIRETSKICCKLAEIMEEQLPPGPEKSAGLRKLLEAKDCFVRARLDDA